MLPCPEWLQLVRDLCWPPPLHVREDLAEHLVLPGDRTDVFEGDWKGVHLCHIEDACFIRSGGFRCGKRESREGIRITVGMCRLVSNVVSICLEERGAAPIAAVGLLPAKGLLSWDLGLS